MAAVRAVAVENIDCTGPVYGFDALVGRADGQVIAAVTIEIATAQRPPNKRVFDLVIDFGTSQSPKSTRPLTTYWCPSSPGHPALRNNFASSLLLRTWLPYDWTPRSEAYFVFPLAQGMPGKQCGLAATGVYQPSLRSPWLAANASLGIGRFVTEDWRKTGYR